MDMTDEYFFDPTFDIFQDTEYKQLCILSKKNNRSQWESKKVKHSSSNSRIFLIVKLFIENDFKSCCDLRKLCHFWPNIILVVTVYDAIIGWTKRSTFLVTTWFTNSIVLLEINDKSNLWYFFFVKRKTAVIYKRVFKLIKLTSTITVNKLHMARWFKCDNFNHVADITQWDWVILNLTYNFLMVSSDAT